MAFVMDLQWEYHHTATVDYDKSFDQVHRIDEVTQDT